MNNAIRKPFLYVNYNTVFWLIGINVLVFVVMRFFGNMVVSSLDIDVSRFGLQPHSAIMTVPITLEGALAMRPFTVLYGYIWTFVTYMFMHANFQHILFNMLGLFIFGMQVERQMGSKEFLLYYFVTGTLAGIFSFFAYYFTGSYFVALVGASGALYAVQLAYAVIFPDAIIYIWGLIPLRAPVMVLGFTALSLFFVFTGRGGNVAHLTHLAGFAFGWLYFVIRFGVNPLRRLLRR